MIKASVVADIKDMIEESRLQDAQEIEKIQSVGALSCGRNRSALAILAYYYHAKTYSGETFSNQRV